MAESRTWVRWGSLMIVLTVIAVAAYHATPRDREYAAVPAEPAPAMVFTPPPAAPDPRLGPVEELLDPDIRQETMETLERIDGRLYVKGETTPFDGYIVELYDDGSFRTRSRIVNGIMDGYSQGWYIDGGLQIKEYFRNGYSDGIRERWHTNGVLAARTEILQGRIHGAFHRWNEDGQLVEAVTMVEGEMHGPSEAYYPSGHVKSRVVMNKGQPLKSEQFKDGELPATL